MAIGKSRYRTLLRVGLPYRPPMYKLVPKGRRDCDNHEWGRLNDNLEVCYFCIAERAYDPAHDLRMYEARSLRQLLCDR
jgi:hypothetical protein